MKIFGLIGKNISYSFSRKYFSEKFKAENIDAVYKNFDLNTLDELKEVLKQNPDIAGFNVTIPYKELIIPYLDELDPTAREIGAVNTIKRSENGKLTGFNTDYFGFVNSLRPLLIGDHSHALILGTGGASKAIAYGLKHLGIKYKFVSRDPDSNQLPYTSLGPEAFSKYTLIINCTPLGTSPEISSLPPIPVDYFTPRHVVYDLIYNPPITRLMQLADDKGARVKNGYQMLELQAQKSWEIWNS